MAKKPGTPATAIEQFAASVPEGAVPDEVTAPSAAPSPSVTEPPALTTPETSVPPAESTPPDFLERVRSLGFADVNDEATAQERLIEALQQRQADLEARERRLQEVEPFARYGQEYMETLRQSQQPKPSEKSESWWNPPQVDPALVRKYQTTDPATGDVKWSADTPAHIRADFEKYQAHIDQWSNKLIYNPREALQAPIQEVVEAYLEKMLGMPVSELPQRLDLSGEQRAYNELVAQHGERIYAKDPITNRIDTTRLTPFGETVEKALERANQMGIAKAQDRLEYAMQIAELKHPAQAQTIQKRETVRKDVLRRNGATGLPQRTGSTVEGRPQNKTLSPGHQMLQRLDGLAS